MSDHVAHCPFLNRSDARCSTNFSLESLDNAYDYCFGAYAKCSIYRELLSERQNRRSREAVGVLSINGRMPWLAEEDRDAESARSRLVPLTLGGRRLVAGRNLSAV